MNEFGSLEAMKVVMGSATLSAQYQQAPVPPGGNMVNWNWFNWYDPKEANGPIVDDIVISWDTAMKPTELSDYSVGTVRGGGTSVAFGAAQMGVAQRRNFNTLPGVQMLEPLPDLRE